MKCPCENETYLCETPCETDGCAYIKGREDAIDECKAVILERCNEPCSRGYDCLQCRADKCERLKEKKYDTI